MNLKLVEAYLTRIMLLIGFLTNVLLKRLGFV
jgi:hypothetical protein